MYMCIVAYVLCGYTTHTHIHKNAVITPNTTTNILVISKIGKRDVRTKIINKINSNGTATDIKPGVN